MTTKKLICTTMAAAMLASNMNIISLAADFTVPTNGTFAQAVAAANARAAGSPAYTIDVSGTQAGGGYFSKAVSITGAGAGATLTGSQMTFAGGTAITNSLNNIVLTGGNGYWGGMISNGDPYAGGGPNLNITNSSITNSATSRDGGAIFNSGGTINITNTAITGNRAYALAGAISNAAGTINVSGGSFANNRADSGGSPYYNNAGAINNVGTLNVTAGTTFSNNFALINGGAINNSGNLSINNIGGNSSFTGNTAAGSGGAINNSSGANQVTLTGVNFGTSADNGNSATSGGGIYNGGGTIKITGGSFTGNKATATGLGGGAIYNAATINIDGGTSFASNTSAAQGGGIYNYGTVTVDGNSAFTNNTAAANGGAIYNNGTYTANNGGTYTGNTAASSGGAIYNARGRNVTVGNATFTNNKVTGSGSSNGGAIYNEGALTVNNSTFDTNTATGNINSSDGGAIYNNAGTATVNNSTIKGSTGNNGGAIRNKSVLNINNTAFTSNTATGYGGGGAVFNDSGATTTVVGGSFAGNTVNSSGGAIYNNGTLNLDTTGADMTFSGNKAAGRNSDIQTSNMVVIRGDASHTLSMDGGFSGGGTINKTGGLLVSKSGAINSGYTGVFNQTGGTTTIEYGASMFGGGIANNRVSNSILNVTADTINYGVTLGNAGILNHYGKSIQPTDIDNTHFVFSGTGAVATFDRAPDVTDMMKYNLNSKVDNGQANTLTINNANVGLGSTDYTGKTTYVFNNDNLDMTKDNTINTTTFDNMASTNTKLSFDVSANPANPGGLIASDRLVINNPVGNIEFSIGTMRLLDDKDNGLTDIVVDDVLTGAKFKADSTGKLATTAYEYDASVNAGGTGLTFKAHTESSNKSLNNMNIYNGERGFNFSFFTQGETYEIEKSLDQMAAGNFAVTGYDGDPTHSIITGGGTKSMFNMTNATDFKLRNLTIQDTSGSNGAALSMNNSAANANVSNVIFKNNKATGGGGAIYHNSGTLDMVNASFTDNSAGNEGGAIYNNGDLNINNSLSFTGNSATQFGGAIFNQNSGKLTVNGANFGSSESGNTAKQGGAIYNNGGTASVANSNFTGNTSTEAGGAIANFGTMDITKGFFTGNTSNIEGGAISNFISMDIKGGTFTGNTAAVVGGAIYNYSAGKLILDTSADNITFTGNKAAGSNNDIYTDGAVTIQGSESNTLSMDGGFSGTGTGTVTKTGSTLVFRPGADSSKCTGTFTQTGGTTTNLGTSKFFGGASTIDNGTLNWMSDAASKVNTSSLAMNMGTLNIGADRTFATLDLNNANDIIQGAAQVNLAKGSALNISNAGSVTINEGDVWDGRISLTGSGNLTVDNYKNEGPSCYTQTAGHALITNGSELTLCNDSSITGGDLTVNKDSILHISGKTIISDQTHVIVDNGLINSIDGMLTNHSFGLGNLTSSTNPLLDSTQGMANFNVDVNGTNFQSDTFTFNQINGNINVSEFNFLTQPSAYEFDIPVFYANNIRNGEKPSGIRLLADAPAPTFTATQSQIVAPVGIYNIQSYNNGVYGFRMDGYNPQVFRGQVSTAAMYASQLAMNNTLFDHVYIDSYEPVAKGRKNQYAVGTGMFAPYQFDQLNGGLWAKTYVNFEKLQMTQGLDIGNNLYGQIVGADFCPMELGNGWKFIPTVFLAYNGGHQTFNGTSMYQNGGQGGFLGTFAKHDFIGSIMAYAGGYANEMSVADTTDRTGNWFAGTAAKAAYNFHPHRHWTLQPSAMISYNVFGKQNWHSNFGALSMNSGMLNGINVAPGLNLIYGNCDDWNVYLTTMYMFNINDQISGRAGSFDLPKVSMRHGYFEYGVGGTKTFKERLIAWGQVTLRNGGRTGVALQFGLQWKF